MTSFNGFQLTNTQSGEASLISRNKRARWIRPGLMNNRPLLFAYKRKDSKLSASQSQSNRTLRLILTFRSCICWKRCAPSRRVHERSPNSLSNRIDEMQIHSMHFIDLSGGHRLFVVATFRLPKYLCGLRYFCNLAKTLFIANGKACRREVILSDNSRFDAINGKENKRKWLIAFYWYLQLVFGIRNLLWHLDKFDL